MEKICNIIDITKEELNEIKKTMKDKENRILFTSEKVQCRLFKHRGHVYEIVDIFGDKPFIEVFKDMVKCGYGKETIELLARAGE